MHVDQAYVVTVVRQVRQQLVELAQPDRVDALECLRTELTGEYGDQTSKITAWHLAEDLGPYWTTFLSCGLLAAYRSMLPREVDDWERRNGQRLEIPGFVVLYLVVDVDPSGAQ